MGCRVGRPGDAGGNRWSVGLGLRHQRWDFDVALVPYGDLGLSERLSISYAFGREPNSSPRQEAGASRPSAPARPPALGTGESDRLIAEADRLVDRGKWEKAGQALVKAGATLGQRDERQVHVLERIGLVSLELGRIAQARNAYTLAIQKAGELNVLPSSVADSYAGLGAVLAKEGKAQYARKFLEKALQASPSAATRREVEKRLRTLK